MVHRGGRWMHGSEDDEDARRELLRLMDQHPSGQQQQEPPPLPLPNPLPFLNAKKGYIHSEGRVGGHKTAVMGFDRDKNYRLAIVRKASVCPAK